MKVLQCESCLGCHWYILLIWGNLGSFNFGSIPCEAMLQPYEFQQRSCKSKVSEVGVGGLENVETPWKVCPLKGLQALPPSCDFLKFPALTFYITIFFFLKRIEIIQRKKESLGTISIHSLEL